MKEGPDISIIAALIGNPASANMLMALMAGPALTATELAQEAGLMLSTASGHLAKLENAGLVAVERQGRHRYFRLADADVAIALEGLMPLAARAGHTRVRTGPRDPELRQARSCYDNKPSPNFATFYRLRPIMLLLGMHSKESSLKAVRSHAR